MTTEEFLRDVCPNHTDTSKWNKSELLHILELHTEKLRKHTVVRQSEQLVCPVCKNRRIKQDPKWDDNECLNCNKIWAK